MQAFSLNISYGFSPSQKAQVSLSYPSHPHTQSNSYLIPCNPDGKHPNIVKLEPRVFPLIPRPNNNLVNATPSTITTPLKPIRVPLSLCGKNDSEFQEQEELEKSFEDSTSKMLKQSRKISKDPSCSKNPSKRKKNLSVKKSKWTPEEDRQIIELLGEYGEKWTNIADIIGGRSGKQVRERYLNVLKPGINHSEWTEEEDQIFMSLCQTLGKRWCQIAEHLPGRTESQVKNRYYTKNRKQLSKDSASEMSSDMLKSRKELSVGRLGSDMTWSSNVTEGDSVDSFFKLGFDEDFDLNKMNVNSHYDDIKWN